MTAPAARQPLLSHLLRLAGHSLVYGSADVVSQAVNLLLTPLYVAILQPGDFGVLAVLALFSVLAKILFRMGLETGFFRIYYDLKTEEARRQLAGTVALFCAVVGAVLFALVVVSTPALVWLLFEKPIKGLLDYILLVTADVYVGTFLFVPLSLLRIRNQPERFALSITFRNVLNTGLKVALVLAGRGVGGVLWSDLLATTALVIVLAPTLVRGCRWSWSWIQLREVLAFGLPKAPHGLLVQVLNLADRRLLSHFDGLKITGLYDKAYVLGAGVKFIVSAFEPAWQPFVYSHLGREDAPRLFARLVTYVWAAFLGVGLAVAVLGRELLVAFTCTNSAFWAAAPVVPVVALAYSFHGAFLLTSIGIGIAKKARYYPIVTGAAAAVNVASNLLLIPRWGMLGAAWATVFAYAVMAALGLFFSRRVYPIPFEVGRIGRLAAAAGLTYSLSLLAPDLHLAGVAPIRSIPVFVWEFVPRHLLVPSAVKLLTLVAYPALAVAFGVLSGDEWAWLRVRLPLRWARQQA